MILKANSDLKLFWPTSSYTKNDIEYNSINLEMSDIFTVVFPNFSSISMNLKNNRLKHIEIAVL